MGWLAHVPILIALPLYAAIFAAVAMLAHAAFRRSFPPERMMEQYDVAGYLVAVVGVLYSVVLGLLVGTAWTAFSTAQQTTDLEAGYVADAFNFAAQLHARQARDVQRTIARYAFDVRDAELRSGRMGGTGAAGLLSHAVRSTIAMPAPPASAGAGYVLEENALRSALTDTLREIGDARRLRFLQAESRFPAGMLEALILGAALVVAFAFFFGVKSFLKQMTMTGLIAGSIGLFFGLVMELSTPYTGALRVSTAAWTFVIDSNHFSQFARTQAGD